MLALTPRVTHKILFERVQFAMFLQLLGASPPHPHQGLCPWTPLGNFCPPAPLQNWTLPRSKNPASPPDDE